MGAACFSPFAGNDACSRKRDINSTFTIQDMTDARRKKYGLRRFEGGENPAQAMSHRIRDRSPTRRDDDPIATAEYRTNRVVLTFTGANPRDPGQARYQSERRRFYVTSGKWTVRKTLPFWVG